MSDWSDWSGWSGWGVDGCFGRRGSVEDLEHTIKLLENLRHGVYEEIDIRIHNVRFRRVDGDADDHLSERFHELLGELLGRFIEKALTESVTRAKEHILNTIEEEGLRHRENIQRLEEIRLSIIGEK